MIQEKQAIALFSGGLDSILAARMIQNQGIAVKCLHFVSPFFGKPQEIPAWEKAYGLSIEPVDISTEFVQMLREEPAHGYGKVMNPCVDCKILMMRKAAEIMRESQASFLVSGEVIGQRPMSQRRDTLYSIMREAEVSGDLLRPLCAQHLPPTKAELSGIVDRSQLGSIFGRGRHDQLLMARQWHIFPIPTPAGGCRLAEAENARRYWPVLTYLPDPNPQDFFLANVGRQFWQLETPQTAWLILGRNEQDNLALAHAVGWESEDEQSIFAPKFSDQAWLLRLAENVPGPLGLLRLLPNATYQDKNQQKTESLENKANQTLYSEQIRSDFLESVLHEATALLASYSSAARAEASVKIQCFHDGEIKNMCVAASRQSHFLPSGPDFQTVYAALHKKK